MHVVIFDLAFSDETGMAWLQNWANTNRDLKVMIHAADARSRMHFRMWPADAFVMKSPGADKLKSAAGRLCEAWMIRISKSMCAVAQEIDQTRAGEIICQNELLNQPEPAS